MICRTKEVEIGQIYLGPAGEWIVIEVSERQAKVSWRVGPHEQASGWIEKKKLLKYPCSDLINRKP